jgi:aminopeptidase N
MCACRLNEGITTYLERKIIAKLYGEKERHLHAINGWDHMKTAVSVIHVETVNLNYLKRAVPIVRIHMLDYFHALQHHNTY